MLFFSFFIHKVYFFKSYQNLEHNRNFKTNFLIQLYFKQQEFITKLKKKTSKTNASKQATDCFLVDSINF